jgi:hypothetical protein
MEATIWGQRNSDRGAASEATADFGDARRDARRGEPERAIRCSEQCGANTGSGGHSSDGTDVIECRSADRGVAVEALDVWGEIAERERDGERGSSSGGAVLRTWRYRWATTKDWSNEY